ncbi:MAG TPA: protein kinase [Gemmatimonadaceae bacterium]|nr:protein kinase [Gemmatimonadaceae bacterium]
MNDPKIPDIGKYHIIELVGEGAMGVVYRAEDSVLHRTVAIKVMNESIARQDDSRKRFLHEAQAAASLQHPNVVCIYDLGEVGGHLFIAMEFVDGVDLEKLLEMPQQLTLQARLDIVIDVLTGLSFAHKRGIVHRDIKPANIRVAEDGRAKIMDFGVAHLASSSMTSAGAILGTPSYMAPEQITDGKTSPASDLFAVGCVLYQLLTQMRPFDGPTLQTLFFKIITERQRKVTELMPGLPPALDRILEKAMAKEPANRYASALDMANDLSAVRSKLSGPSYPESVSLSASVSSAIEQVRKSKTRSKNFAFAGAGAVFAIAVLLGWSQFAKPRQAPPAAATQQAGTAGMPAAPAATDPGNAAAPTETTASRDSVIPPRSPESPTREQQQLAAAARTRAAPPKPAPARPAPSRVAQTSPQTSAQVSAPAPIVQAPAQNPVFIPPQVTTSQQPPPVVAREPVRQPAIAAPSPPTSADISPVIQAYARAIESRDIGAIRRVYPDLTAAQQRGFDQFFRSARDINVTFRVANVEGTASAAEARLVGSYDYVNSAGQGQHQPVSFAATLRNGGNGWRLVSVR